jgi:hypothetical protein
MIMQMTLRKPRKITIGIPTRRKHRGTARTIYKRIESWKLRDDFPF